MQYHAIPCNTMQYHGTLLTADGAYHCPVGSIMAIFYVIMFYLQLYLCYLIFAVHVQCRWASFQNVVFDTRSSAKALTDILAGKKYLATYSLLVPTDTLLSYISVLWILKYGWLASWETKNKDFCIHCCVVLHLSKTSFCATVLQIHFCRWKNVSAPTSFQF